MRGPGFHSWPHRQQAWVCVVGLLFVADFIFYGYLPAHRRLRALEESRLQKARLIEAAETQQQTLPSLRETLEATQAAAFHYERSIPTAWSLGTFQGQLTGIMTANGLTHQVIVPQAEIEADGLKCIPIRMNCKGRLESIFGFCNDLQRMDRLVRIENLRLKNDNGYTGVITLEIEAVIFYRSEKTAQGRPDAAGASASEGLTNGT